LEQAIVLGMKLGASITNFFFLVCIGRGKTIIDLAPDQYEESLQEIVRLQDRYRGIMVQTRCAPHFKRILYENNPESPYTRATGYDGGGCLAATRYCRIDPRGEVTPCPYLDVSAGNIRERPFWQIWEDSQLFDSLRHPVLQGRCGECEFRLLCGGCRARSLVQRDQLMGEDPNCSYVPRGRKEIVVLETARFSDDQVEWTEEARDRLKKIPIFLRPMVKKKLEQRAAREGGPVTSELMQNHREERERELGVKFK
jgi:radical SAM protein with 4Fe4S-binding SPASM domain